MAHFQDYRDFRFWSRDHGRGRMTSLFNFDIDNKGCVIKWPMCSKKFPSYTTNIFLSNAPQKIRQCALKEDCNLEFDWNEDFHPTNWKKLGLKSCFFASAIVNLHFNEPAVWSCGYALLSFCRDVIFLTRIGVFSRSVIIRCCLAPY